jgi:5-methylcytosine-specific restriction protein A
MPFRAPTLNSLFPKPRPKENRQSAAKRGYDRRWQRLRLMVMREEPLCYYCQLFGLIVATTSIDHKIPKARGGTDARTNLSGAGKNCNDRKQDMTAEEFISELQRKSRRVNV